MKVSSAKAAFSLAAEGLGTALATSSALLGAGLYMSAVLNAHSLTQLACGAVVGAFLGGIGIKGGTLLANNDQRRLNLLDGASQRARTEYRFASGNSKALGIAAPLLTAAAACAAQSPEILVAGSALWAFGQAAITARGVHAIGQYPATPSNIEPSNPVETFDINPHNALTRKAEGRQPV